MALESSVKVNLNVGGVAEVQNAFKSVSAAAAQAESTVMRNAKGQFLKKVQMTKEEARMAKQGVSEMVRARIQASRTAQAADIAMMKVGKESSVGWLRGWVTSMDGMKTKSLEATKAVKRAMQDLNSATTLDGIRAGIKNVTKETDKLNKSLAKAKSGGGGGSWSIGSSVGKVGRAGLGAALRVGGMAATLGGGYGVADAVQKVISAENAGVALANSMYNPNDEEQKKFLNGKRFDQSKILALSGKAQQASGVGKAEFLSGVSSYIAKSSDWKSVATDEGQKTLIDLARLSKATGSDFGEVMNAAGSLRVQNENLSPEKMMEMMYGIVGQSKMGAVEMKDLAQHAAVVTSSSGSFGTGKGGYKDQAQAQAALLGLSQIAIQTSGSPAEAATAVKSFAADLNAKGVKAEGRFAGLKLRDENHKLLKASSLIENIFEATKGDSSLMGEGKGHIGLGRESIRIMQALSPTYDQAYSEAKASGKSEADARKAAAKATGDKVRKFENATYSKGDADTDLKQVLNTKGERFNKAMTMLMDVTERRVAPFIEKLAHALETNEPKIEKLIGGIASIADTLIEHPFAGLGAVFGAAVVAEVAKAKLGDILTSALRGGGSGGGSAGGLGGAGLGAGAAIAGVAYTAYMVKDMYDNVSQGMSNYDARLAKGDVAFKTGDKEGMSAFLNQRQSDMANDGALASIGRLGGQLGAMSTMPLLAPLNTLGITNYSPYKDAGVSFGDDLNRRWSMGSGGEDSIYSSVTGSFKTTDFMGDGAGSKHEQVGGLRGQFGQLFDGEMSDADKGLHEVSGSTKGQSPEEMFAENSAALAKSTEAMGTLTTAVDTFANKLPEVLKFGRDGRPILPDK